MNVDQSTENDLIVLVHGFGAKRIIMWPLANRLRSSGFRVRSWNYSSLFNSIEVHANRLFDFLNSQLKGEPRFHIVAHSMGSIVVRSALNKGRLPNLGKLVFLAPPNLGSPVARFASKFVGRLITPSRELSDATMSYVNQLAAPTNIEIGIIAARYDMLVPVHNTHLANETKHVTMNATHNSLLLSRSACEKTANFLRTGTFISY